MKITKHEVDEEGLIRISNVIRLLTMGIRNNVVTIWAVTDPVGKQGLYMGFVVKNDDETVNVTDCQNYITSFINTDGVWHLFSEDQKIQQFPTMPPPQTNPKGNILT